MSEIVRGRSRGHLVVDNTLMDGLLEIGGIDLAGFYTALKRFVDRRDSLDSKAAMPWTVDYFCQKFKMGKQRFYRLAEMLWRVGLLDVTKDYGKLAGREGPSGWRNRYAIHDDPGYEGPLREIRGGTFKHTGEEGRYSDTELPGTKVPGIPIQVFLERNVRKEKYRKDDVVVVTPHPEAKPGQGNQTQQTGNPADEGAPLEAPATCNNLTGEDGGQGHPGFASRVQEAFMEAVGHPLPGEIVSELSGYPLDYVLGKIAMMKQGKEKSNAAGWLLEACREDYRHLPGPKPARKGKGKLPGPPGSGKEHDKYRELYRLV
ncbi:hypothetical protein MGLY_35160 (plasmid) [Neomoorella glycerini]|uniref:Uncharacterized protein n=1 Tax=Neomoorella glycerini TaxID=55779 RepID=A0A6I5ZXS4_9FIRM|nr:hypothetical protein [Moorella glycerini]QGP94091.1 hypothetical protein MGLY_35160 [Moorella glycerini]